MCSCASRGARVGEASAGAQHVEEARWPHSGALLETNAPDYEGLVRGV